MSSHQQLAGSVLTVSAEQRLIDTRQQMSVDLQYITETGPDSPQYSQVTTSQDLMTAASCNTLTGSQQQQKPLLDNQQQWPHGLNAVGSNELLRGHQELALDAVISCHNYIDDLCPVCNDRVSGYHYGLQTCESCKGISLLINFTGGSCIFLWIEMKNARYARKSLCHKLKHI